MAMGDLERAGALTPAMSDFLRSAVAARCPIVISGGTGSGKTTLLNALSEFIPAGERVITLEDTPELRLRTPHTERMQTREANVEGEGAVGMRELVSIALRRRPDRIIVGECRGAEAYDMLQACLLYTSHARFTATIEFSPTLFGLGLKSSVFGVSLPHLEHAVSLTVDPYKPGVLL